MLPWFKKKTLYDQIAEGTFDDAAIAERIKTWILKGTPRLMKRAIDLYDKQTPAKKEEFARHGLTEKFIEKHRNILEKER